MRPNSDVLDGLIEAQTQILVLDHGFVRVVDYMGNDESIAQSARVSIQKAEKRSSTKQLIRYMMSNRHSSPSEMAELCIHVKLPIFVARQWVRHRTANIQEMSGRYSVLDNEFYIPEASELKTQATDNKQGRSDLLISPSASQDVMCMLREDAMRNYDHYEGFLATGLSRELARINLTLNYYTQWYWKIDLHNLLHFLMLRLDAHAQHEIRVYAQVIADIVEAWVPFSWRAFMDYRFDAMTLNRMEIEVIRDVFGEALDPANGLSGMVANIGMSKGMTSKEIEKFMAKLKRLGGEKA